MRFKKFLISLLCAVLFLGMLSGCERDSSEILIVAPDGVPILSIAKIAQEDSLSFSGYSFKYELCAGLDVLQSKLGGDADFAIAPLSNGANLYNTSGLYMLGAVTGFGIMHMISIDPDVVAGDWNTLLGKEIYTLGQGGTPDAMLRYLLDANNISVTDTPSANSVSIGYRDSHQTLWASISTLKTIVTSEPGVSAALANATVGARQIFDLQEEYKVATGGDKAYPQTGLFVKKSLVESNRELVDAVMAAVKGNLDYANISADTRGEVGQNAADFGSAGINAQNAKASFSRVELCFISGAEGKQLAEEYFSKLLDFKAAIIGGKLPDAGFYLS